MKNYEILQKSFAFFIWMLKTLKILKLEVSNIEKLKNIKNSVIVSTHPSFIDIVILISIIPYSTCFVAERLANNPILKGMVKLLFILEGQPLDIWVEEANKMLNKGLNVIIFPMGIRHRKNETPKIRRGASLIAQKSGKNIAMLDLKTSFDFLFIHQPFYKAGSEPVIFSLNYLGEINTKEFREKCPDEVTFKTQVTKEISRVLYKK
ncbi:1-acyl-sn-glycerol-3-phosphate acyltransferase [bacterium]|nr:1-acyl-sn-glycerol-3-phosphate acyltransferase [bacterium]